MNKIHFPALALFASALCILVTVSYAVPPNKIPVVASKKEPRESQRKADFGSESASLEAREVADWVATSQDNAGTAFIIVDKKKSKVYVFNSNANLRAVSPVLLGAAIGDDVAPGIGSKSLEKILPHERTTHAGRFVAELGHNARGEDVVWVDYDAAMSMHRVLTSAPIERRLERLASPSTDDNRISNGCINVPVAFYENYLLPIFQNNRRAIVYVLPELKSARSFFRLWVASNEKIPTAMAGLNARNVK